MNDLLEKHSQFSVLHLQQIYEQFIDMRSLINDSANSYTPYKTQGKLTNRTVMTPRSTARNTQPYFGTKSPQLIKIVDQQVLQRTFLNRQKSHNILNYLDRKQPEVLHKYKKFQNHSKKSDLKQVRDIIQELLNKHAFERKLTPSEQYILTGYFARYIQFAANSPRLIRNPFNIASRIQTNNSPEIISEPVIECVSPRKSVSKNKNAPKFKNKGPIDIKRDELQKQFEMIKFLWQVYLIKCITCPNLCKLSSFQDTQNRRQMLDMVNKLKGIQQKRGKIGEQKALAELGKIMKRFQNRITASLA